MLPGLERAHLVLLGFGTAKDAFARSAEDGAWSGRVHVLDAVAPTDLPARIASADVGAMPIQASTLNHYLSTPNKLFESIGAGVPVVTSDFPTMRAIVDDPAGPLGAVCRPAQVDDVARALREVLTMDPVAHAAMRARCLAAADERWNWEVQSAALCGLYCELATGPH